MLLAEAVLLLLLAGVPQQAESTIPPDPQPAAQAEEAAALPAARAEEQVSQPGEPAEEEGPRRFYWDDGLWLEAPRLRLRMRIGGELHLDTAAFVAPEELEPLDSETGWRRARLDLRGSIGRRVRYRLRWDAASRAPHLKDAYVDIEFLRLNTYVRSGRFSAVFGLENASSSNDYVFMETSLTQVFVPPQETGFLLHSQGREGNWDVGFSGASNEVTSCVLCDIRGVTARFSRGFELAEGRRVLHAGVNWATRWTGEGDFTRYRARPESFLSPYLVDTGLFQAERVDVGLVEAAFQDGPFALLAEYGGAWTRSVEATDPRFESYYVLAVYTLTGEQRPYSHSSGAFGRPLPASRFLADEGGIGAIEVAARYSYLDLNDQRASGGILRDVTMGANWYPSRSQRVTFNVIRAHRSGIDPLWVFQLRLQWSI
jgi:phosphate-selective porin OprO/OprP